MALPRTPCIGRQGPVNYGWGIKLCSRPWRSMPTAQAAAKISSYHTVQAGETMADIARQHGCSIRALKELNYGHRSILKNDAVKPGCKLQVPQRESQAVAAVAVNSAPAVSAAAASPVWLLQAAGLGLLAAAVWRIVTQAARPAEVSVTTQSLVDAQLTVVSSHNAAVTNLLEDARQEILRAEEQLSQVMEVKSALRQRQLQARQPVSNAVVFTPGSVGQRSVQPVPVMAGEVGAATTAQPQHLADVVESLNRVWRQPGSVSGGGGPGSSSPRSPGPARASGEETDDDSATGAVDLEGEEKEQGRLQALAEPPKAAADGQHTGGTGVEVNVMQPAAVEPAVAQAIVDAPAAAVDVPVATAVEAPAVDVPVAAAVEAPAVDVPVAAAVEAPAVDVPVAAAVEAPAVDVPVPAAVEAPAVDVPVAAAVEAPAVDVPVAAVVEAPAVDVPVPAAVEAPPVDVPVSAAVQQPAAEVPAPAALEIPAVAHVEVPAAAAVEMPAAAPMSVPAAAAVQAPTVPAADIAAEVDSTATAFVAPAAAVLDASPSAEPTQTVTAQASAAQTSAAPAETLLEQAAIATTLPQQTTLAEVPLQDVTVAAPLTPLRQWVPPSAKAEHPVMAPPQEEAPGPVDSADQSWVTISVGMEEEAVVAQPDDVLLTQATVIPSVSVTEAVNVPPQAANELPQQAPTMASETAVEAYAMAMISPSLAQPAVKSTSAGVAVTAAAQRPAPVVESIPYRQTLLGMKSALLEGVYATDRGTASTGEQRAVAEELISALECRNPNTRPSDCLDVLAGRWKLVYTSSPQTLLLLSALHNLPLVELGDVYQQVDVESMTARNKIEIKVPLAFTLHADTCMEVRTPRALKVRLTRVGVDTFIQTPQVLTALEMPDTLDLWGTPLDLAPVRRYVVDPFNAVLETSKTLIGRAVSPELDLQATESTCMWMLTTYLDDTLRITRDGSGHVFVMLKDEPEA